jgi:hypothetical protein
LEIFISCFAIPQKNLNLYLSEKINQTTVKLLLQFIFIFLSLGLYVISFNTLKPFRRHKKRSASTIALKLSYLLFLIVFMLIVYLLTFKSHFPVKNDFVPIRINPVLVTFIALTFSIFIPNAGIIFRRKFNKSRAIYNVIFTVINIFTTIVLVTIIFTFPWK